MLVFHEAKRSGREGGGGIFCNHFDTRSLAKHTVSWNVDGDSIDDNVREHVVVNQEEEKKKKKLFLKALLPRCHTNWLFLQFANESRY